MPNYVTVSDRFIIKADKYIRMINQKYQLEKRGLAVVDINDGELEIVDSDVSESDERSEISEQDLEESEDDRDPTRRKMKLRDRYMLEQYAKESKQVQLDRGDYKRIKIDQQAAAMLQ